MLLALFLSCMFLFISSTHGSVESISSQQILESLSYWDWQVAPPAQSSFLNTKYNSLKITKDAARVWTPIYPDRALLSRVKVTLTPTCEWPEIFDEATGNSKGFNITSICPKENKTDVLVSISLNYSVYEGNLLDGTKSIAFAPTDKSPVPWVKKVENEQGVPLNYTLYRDKASKEWWIHYFFSNPGSKVQYVNLEYQIRNVLTATDRDTNKFSAAWLQEWDAPVQAMDIHWIFPPNVKPTRFDVAPANNNPDDAPSQLTAVCCGDPDTSNMKKCTYDMKLAREWASTAHEFNTCLNQSVVLVTYLRLAEGFWADADAGVNLNNLYSISFSPALVTKSAGNVEPGKSYMWILPLLLILVFPCLGAVLWMMPEPARKAHSMHDA